MGVIGRLIGIGEDSKQKAAEKWQKKNIKWQRDEYERNKEMLEKIKLRVSEGKEQHVINVFLEDKEYGMEQLIEFVTANPGIIPSYVLPTDDLKAVNEGFKNIGDYKLYRQQQSVKDNSSKELELQKRILELEKEKLAMQLEIEKLKNSSNNIKSNSPDIKLNKLISWGYYKEKAIKVSDEEFEQLEYWYQNDKELFNDLLKIELDIDSSELIQENL